jgi:hypothetical protein
MPMGYFSAFRRPRPNLFLGFGQTDSTSRAEESLRTTGGAQSIYEASDQVNPLQSEIVAYPETDPAVAQAVTRVQTVPQTVFMTRTPQALVAQPITYEQMKQDVSPFNWWAGREPTVRLAYTPAPTWLNRYVPSETMPHTIPNMQRIARDGGMMLPRMSESYSAPEGSDFGAQDMRAAAWAAYLAAFGAQASGTIPVGVPGANDLETPVTTQHTIPQMQFKSPVPEETTDMEMLVKSGNMKQSQAGLVESTLSPEMLPFVQSQDVGTKSIPTWAWVAIAIGAYFLLRGKSNV